MSSYHPNPQSYPSSDTVAPLNQNPGYHSDHNPASPAHDEIPSPGPDSGGPAAGSPEAEAFAYTPTDLLKIQLPFVEPGGSIPPQMKLLGLFLHEIVAGGYDSRIGVHAGVKSGPDEDPITSMRKQLPGIRLSGGPLDSGSDNSSAGMHFHTGLTGLFFATNDHGGMPVDDIMAKMKGSPEWHGIKPYFVENQ